MHKTLLLLAIAAPLGAQIASIRGQVSDESGAVVPKAKVTLTGLGVVRTVLADERGFYVLSSVPRGDYQISAAATDLASQPAAISVDAAPITANLLVKIVSTTQRVTVQEQTGPAISTDPSNN